MDILGSLNAGYKFVKSVGSSSTPATPATPAPAKPAQHAKEAIIIKTASGNNDLVTKQQSSLKNDGFNVQTLDNPSTQDIKNSVQKIKNRGGNGAEFKLYFDGDKDDLKNIDKDTLRSLYKDDLNEFAKSVYNNGDKISPLLLSFA